MLDWARELIHRLERSRKPSLEIPEWNRGRPQDWQGSPTAPREAFARFLQEFEAHNEEEIHQHPMGKRSA